MWSLNWALTELRSVSRFRQHRETLIAPWKFYFSLIAKLIPGAWPFPVTLHLKRGGAFEVRQFMTLYIYAEIFVDRCYDFPPLPTANPVIIDVGANTGLFALRMKQLYPHAHIYGFEPVPANYIQLERTIALSHLEHTYPFRQGVGGVARQDTLFLHDKNIGGHSLYQQPTGSRQTLTIDLVDLPSVLARMQGNRCDLLKLDCEGAEYEIITHMDKETAARVPRVVFEPSPSLYDPNVLHQHLSAIGYRVEKNQGLYVASLAA